MAARVCATCLTRWPDDISKYGTCPRCEVGTVYSFGAEPIGRLIAGQWKDAYEGFRQWLRDHPNLKFEKLDLSRFDRVGPDQAAELERITGIGTRR